MLLACDLDRAIIERRVKWTLLDFSFVFVAFASERSSGGTMPSTPGDESGTLHTRVIHALMMMRFDLLGRSAFRAPREEARAVKRQGFMMSSHDEYAPNRRSSSAAAVSQP